MSLDPAAKALAYAWRSLRRNPGFSITVLLTLALGLGLNAAIFNLLEAVILRPLPLPRAEQLRFVRVKADNDSVSAIFSYPVFGEMQAAAGSSARIAAFSSMADVRAVESGKPLHQADIQLVSGDYFSTLGVRAQAGRLLAASDDTADSNFPAVISAAYWARRFGRSPNVVGEKVSLNDTPVTIVGVAADGFYGMEPGSEPAYWLPVSAQQPLRYQSNFWDSNGNAAKPFILQPQIRWLTLVARIPDRSREARVLAALEQVFARDMQREVHGWSDPVRIRQMLGARLRFEDGAKGLGDLRHRFAAPLTVLMCAAGLVLLIACANLASLALARVNARRKEIAVRCSLGASRASIAAHLAAESALLSGAGALLALPVALAASKLLVRWASRGDPLPIALGLSAPLLLFTLGSACFAALVFGLAPAWEAVHVEISDWMKNQATGIKGAARLPWGRSLIAIQVMFAFVLLAGAAMFLRTFLNYASVALGFSPERVVSVQLDPVGAHYTREQLTPIYRNVLARLAETPGVRDAAFASCGLADNCRNNRGVSIAGKSTHDYRFFENYVTPDYFRTVGMRLVRGRLLDEHDTGTKPIYAVINETAARDYFPGVDPIGQHFGDGGILRQCEIVGVLADARVIDVHDAAEPMAYYSLFQVPDFAGRLEVRTTGDGSAMQAAIRTALRESAPGLPLIRMRLVTEQVGSNLVRERLLARLGGAFALLALGLACLGVYGVFSYTTARRTSEMGLRLALGAQGSDLRWMILREALLVAGVGLALGVPVTLLLTQFVRGLLYGLTPSDPISLLWSLAVLAAVAGLAAFGPAWRASRIDPARALRME